MPEDTQTRCCDCGHLTFIHYDRSGTYRMKNGHRQGGCGGFVGADVYPNGKAKRVQCSCLLSKPEALAAVIDANTPHYESDVA